MFEFLFVSCFILLMLIGLVYFVGECIDKYIYSDKTYASLSIVKMSGKSEDAEFKLRNAVFSNSWSRLNRCGAIVVINDDMDADTLCVCKTFSRQNNGVYVVNKNTSVLELFNCIEWK